MKNVWVAVVILSTLVLLDKGNCQTQYKNGEQQQNWGNEWRNLAGTLTGNGGPGGNTGGGNQWLQIADRYMSQWMSDYAAHNANGTNPTGGFFASLMDRINKTKKEKKNKKDKAKTEPYIAPAIY